MRQHDEVVESIRRSAEPASIPQVAEIRCSGRDGKCGAVVAWVGKSSQGYLMQYNSGARKWRWGRGPTDTSFDLIEMPGDRPLEVGCHFGHGPWTIDRGRLLEALRAGRKSLRVVAVSTSFT